ncbi:MarR family winged helix-turn-helix transcriptional regulator [Microbacterium gorillae]|uniref:MarR family winged helix-turn-helix transcriptional regulator n=1 Tax=Microbacterium gorillae TaxID=1231063 RepID=UPI0006943563|nr:MarR family winged helix-turn-helix transcriptional regulator [Microbacterium gorillae]
MPRTDDIPASRPGLPASTGDRVDAIIAEWRRERPDVDPSPQGVIGRLHRVADMLDAELTANFARFSLTRGEFDVLATLRRAGSPFGRTAGELAEHTMITSGGLTKRVDRLIARGLVERNVDDADARRRLIALTPAGVALVDEAFTSHMALEHRLLQPLGGDGDILATVLRRWLIATDG